MDQPDPFIHALQEWSAVFVHNVMHSMMRYSKTSGFSISQLRALVYLHRAGVSGVSEIAEDLDVSKAAVSQIIERLVSNGLIDRVEDPNDRRAKQITLTDAGLMILKDSTVARESWFMELSESLTHEQKRQITSCLILLKEKAESVQQYS